LLPPLACTHNAPAAEKVNMHDIAATRVSRDETSKPADVVLREASAVLKAAQKYAAEIFEIGITDNELCHVRKLMARVAAHHRMSLENRTSALTEIHELQMAKEVILRAVELKFGSTSDLFRDFCRSEGKEPHVYSHGTS
jgi:hypothetical protein